MGAQDNMRYLRIILLLFKTAASALCIVVLALLIYILIKVPLDESRCMRRKEEICRRALEMRGVGTPEAKEGVESGNKSEDQISTEDNQ
ncbi:MAG: hypothetical protein JXR23_05525 [Pontiellaceae bacterium]|nr:hypothetical protein [Pontiellaceae bacterium]